MPEYRRITRPNRYLIETVDGNEIEVRGLRLDQRDLWVFRYAEFRQLLQQESAEKPSIQFWQLYDDRLPDGTLNPDHSTAFHRLTDQLLAMHGIRSADISADTAVGLLISYEGGRSLLELLEFPLVDSEPEEAEDPIEGDGTAIALATVATHTGGDLSKAKELIESMPWVELEETMRVSNLIAERQMKRVGDRTAPTAPKTDPQPAQQDIAVIQAEMKRKFEEQEMGMGVQAIAAAAREYGPDAAEAALRNRR